MQTILPLVALLCVPPLAACGGHATNAVAPKTATAKATTHETPPPAPAPASPEDSLLGMPNACERGDARACEKKCDRGEADACGVLALMLMDGRNVEKDTARGSALFERGCDGGDGASCLALAFMSESGMNAPKDPARAAEKMKRSVSLLEHACGGAKPTAKEGECFLLARLYEEGKLVPADRAHAEAVFVKACDDGDIPMCDQLAGRLADGRLGHRDLGLSAKLFARGCDAGFGASCMGLGILTRDGLGVTEDPLAARAFFQKACDTGTAEACNLLDPKEMAHVEDQKAEIKKLVNACRAHDENACKALRNSKLAR